MLNLLTQRSFGDSGFRWATLKRRSEPGSRLHAEIFRFNRIGFVVEFEPVTPVVACRESHILIERSRKGQGELGSCSERG